MYEIYFYKDKNGKEPALEYILELEKKSDKDSRIKLTKIRDYIKILKTYGLQSGSPFIKHIDGDIWELRPLKDRFFFIVWTNGNFVILHQFRKKTQKTPIREIAKAKRELADLKKRGVRFE